MFKRFLKGMCKGLRTGFFRVKEGVSMGSTSDFYGGFGFRVQGTVQSLGWIVLGLTKALQRFVLVGVSGFGFMASA